MKHRLLAVPLLLALAAPTLGHDTDQYSVPVGQEMADLGPMLSERFAGVLRKGVDKLNQRIRGIIERDLRSIDPGSRPPPGTIYDPEGVLDRCHSPEGVAQAVWSSFGPAVDLIEGLEREVYTKKFKAQYPDTLTAYKAKSDWDSVYNKAYSPIDPRNISAIFHASTINMYGVYLGTDKLGHFADMGYHYFKTYHGAIRKGQSEEEAMLKAVRLGTHGIFSERGLLGYLTAGSYSNADLVSNYAGCLFYRNLTEPVVIKGRLYPPILERDGDYWKLGDDVDDATLFKRFISDHWNEALNPSLYEPLMRGTVRKLVEARNADLLEFYKDKYASHDPAEYFTQLAETLKTYYGNDYGHNGDPENLFHIGNTMPQDDDQTRLTKQD